MLERIAVSQGASVRVLVTTLKQQVTRHSYSPSHPSHRSNTLLGMKSPFQLACCATAACFLQQYPSHHQQQRSLFVTAAFLTSYYSIPSASAASSTSRNAKSFTSLAASKMDQSFPTWTFDKPCTSIQWNELVTAELVVESIGSADQLNDADLVMVGVMAPPKDDDSDDSAEEEDKDKEEEETTPVSLTGIAKEADVLVGGALSVVMQENAKDFQNGGKTGSMTPTLRVVGADKKSTRYIVLGLGKTPKEGDDEKKKDDPLATAGHSLGKAIADKCNSEKKVESVVVVLPSDLVSKGTVLRDLSAAFYETLYSDNRYRTGKKIKKAAEDLKKVTIVVEGGDGAPDAAAAIEAGRKLATGIFMAKDIVNSPHNVLNSVSLADTAKRMAAQSGGTMTCTILDKKECEKRGMGAYLGVARGSETEPQFIHLTYKPKSGKINKKVGIVGKGLLFDTGGYNIKTAMMELMKFDCGGAAAVLGAARAVAALAPEGVEAHFIVAACENMINAKAIVPSDILTASNGKTIEVLNTDAEGRLTLADALVFADKEVGCEKIIELSTLTGACMVSLGKGMAGVWTDNDDLAEELADISKVTGDKSWRMPMEKSYNEQLESKIADLKNIGTRYGGAITAALFLQNFVSGKKPYAHIDIAGPVWSDKIGATGYGAKMVAEWVRRQGLEE